MARESNNALATDAVGGTVTFAGFKHSVAFVNDGANDVSVQMYAGGDTIAIHVHAATGSRTIKPSEHFAVEWEAHEGGIGYTGFSWRGAAASTLRWYAK
jgi:hypothetical protein